MNSKWHKGKDDKGEYFAPFQIRRTKYFTIPKNRAEIADALNANGWELDNSGFVAYTEADQPFGEATVELPPGVYFHEVKDHAYDILRPMEIREDRLVRLPRLTSHIVRDIKGFINGEEKYTCIGIQYRMGILLYGPPGNGKTLLIRDIIRNELPEDAVVIFLSSLPDTAFLQAMNKKLRDRLKVIVFEELTAVIKHRIDSMLEFLDGETSLDKCLVLATTNYPEQLSGNLVDRPSRFDRIYSLPEPDEDSRRILLDFFLGRSATEEELALTHGFSSAYLKEVALMTRIHSMGFAEAVENLRNREKLVKREFAKKEPIGIRVESGYYDD